MHPVFGHPRYNSVCISSKLPIQAELEWNGCPMSLLCTVHNKEVYGWV